MNSCRRYPWTKTKKNEDDLLLSSELYFRAVHLKNGRRLVALIRNIFPWRNPSEDLHLNDSLGEYFQTKKEVEKYSLRGFQIERQQQ